ncbi:MAG: hypothetical protein R6U84_01775 [Candidatus Cloacimonadales bacterium]
MDKAAWGKFTVRGTEKVEQLIRDMVAEIATTIIEDLPESDYEALIMLGGYGRGEGGVVIEAGMEKPHNNFDFILLSNNQSESENDRIKKALMLKLEAKSKKLNIGIDLSVISARKLQSAACRIIWYDMRFGHKTIYGNADFVPALRHFSLDKIPAWDARNLLVNRGTLMIINDLILEKAQLDEKLKRLIVKHIIKAIIGYGDTLLFFLDDYSWSYLQKQQKMQQRSDVNEKFKAIYDEAMNFRFQPDYPKYLAKDLGAWTEELREHFQEIFLLCESKRLQQQSIIWSQYPSKAFQHAWGEQFWQAKPFAKKIYHLLKTQKTLKSGNFKAKLGFKSLGEAGVLPILFPLFAYKLSEPKFKEIAQDFLDSPADFAALRRAYLRYWGKYGDLNFVNTLKKYKIALDEKGGPQ